MAEAVEQEAYERLMSRPVGDDYSGDGSEEAQSAFDIGLSFYENISDMYQATINLFAAGLFHVIEQQLADLTRDAAMEEEVSDTKLQVVIAWYKQHFEVDLTECPWWSIVDELRLVANTTKHAEGSSAVQLRTRRPELFQRPRLRQFDSSIPMFPRPVHLPLGGDGLYVTADLFRVYHKAAVDLFEWLAKYFEDHPDEYYPK